jgi:FkbM family methyltransferase
MINKLYHFIVRLLPFKMVLVRMAAQLPISFKSNYLFRFISNVATYCNQQTYVLSNLGISNTLKVKVSIAHPIAAFGTPEIYTQETATLALSTALLKHSDAFIDVGANLGYFCFYVDEHNEQQKPIHYFEPDTELFQLLEENRIKNGKNFIAHQQAISNINGPLTFYRNLSDDSSGSIKNTFEGKHHLVPISIDSISFDSFAASLTEQKLILKVDVEGAEFEFLSGAENQFQKIEHLIIELLQDSIDQQFPLLMIEKYGYYAYYINNFNLEHSLKGEYTYVSPYYNWLFSKDAPSVLTKKLSDTAFKVIENTSA